MHRIFTNILRSQRHAAGLASLALIPFIPSDFRSRSDESSFDKYLHSKGDERIRVLKLMEDEYKKGKLKVPPEVSPTTWVFLALEKSPITHLHLTPYDRTMVEVDEFELLSRLNLDDVWKKALTWYSVNLCSEDDLSCQEDPHVAFQKKPSRIQRLTSLLRVLLYKTEFESCSRLVDQGLLSALYRIFLDSHAANKPLAILILQVLANVAGSNKYCAERIVASAWYHQLAELVVCPKHQEEAVIAHKVLINTLHSLGYERALLTPGIYELYRPPANQSVELDVVFVHGLRGTALRTWRQKDRKTGGTTNFWPKDWLPRDLPRDRGVRILAVDYTSRFVQFGQVMESITDRSRKFQHVFHLAGIGERPVIFVCHSMGGLLIKSMLLDNPDLRRRTLGILFMATPHSGSPVASNFAYGVFRPTDDVKLLRVESDINKSLHNAFTEWLATAPDLNVVTMIERHATPMFGTKQLLVPPESAFLGRGAVYHIDEHHHNVCKPDSRRATSYAVILNFILDALASL